MIKLNYLLAGILITGVGIGGFYTGRYSSNKGISESEGHLTINISDERLIEKYGGEENIRKLLRSKISDLYANLLSRDLIHELQPKKRMY